MLSFAILLIVPGLVTAALHSGAGIWDATGPISDVVMMGMANPKQINAGLHLRLRSRAFVAVDSNSGKRFAFVSLDSGMGSLVLNNRVIAELEKRYPGVYTELNVAISGTHTHSGPSGFLQDTMFQFSGSGWVPHTVDAMVEGVVGSIVMAHENVAVSKASWNVGELRASNINRSPTAYLLNPSQERDRYTGDTDLNMTLLKFENEGGEPFAMFNWFAVHPTSLNNTNLLVSGDNKGYASYLFEREQNGPTSTVPTGLGNFVAAFASTNLGDVSPNTKGPACADTGLPCDVVHSTCNNRTELCWASGPGVDMYDSCRIIGLQQFEKAKELFAEPGTALAGTVDYVHTYVKMPGLPVNDPTTGMPLGNLCAAAMGDSFAAGTTDGPGAFDFTQGNNSSNPFWHFIVGFIHKVTPEEKACQAPKGVLLPTGSIDFPWPWAPDTLPMQILRIGDFVILVVPTEMTTMAGRRLRNAVKSRLVEKGTVSADSVVVIAGLANSYADYTTTWEEYQQQRYEGGSTIYGPNQLNAYIQEFLKLADHLAAGTTPPPGPTPTDFSDSIFHFKNYTEDHLPTGAKDFGDILSDAQANYKPGDIATVTFAGANPVNDLHAQSTFVEVQRCLDDVCGSYDVVAVDGDWETRISITKVSVGLLEKARTWDISWYIPQSVESGSYRLLHRGTRYHEPLVGQATFTPYQGVSSLFVVTA